jgi:hypothetical protein
LLLLKDTSGFTSRESAETLGLRSLEAVKASNFGLTAVLSSLDRGPKDPELVFDNIAAEG